MVGLAAWLAPLVRELLVLCAPALVEIVRAAVRDSVVDGNAPADVVARLQQRVRDAHLPDSARATRAAQDGTDC